MSKKQLWIGRIMSGLAVAFLAFDSIIHMLRVSASNKWFMDLGFDPNLGLVIGVVLLVCLILYIVPRTAFLGALLITAYLGGAVAINVLTKSPLFGVFFAAIVGVFVWAGLYVTSARLRALLSSKINA